MAKKKKGGLMIDFAAKCRIVRAAKGWTQGDLAKAVGVDWTTISAWENNKRKRSGYRDTTEKVEKLFEEFQGEMQK